MSAADVASVTNTILLVLGWAIVHFASRNRDRDKARRELVVKACDSLSEQVTKLLSVAMSYHTATARDGAKEIELKGGLQDLSTQTQFINRATRPQRNGVQSNTLHTAFKQSITGQHFEDEWQTPLPAHAGELNQIAATALSLRSYFAELKYEQFDT